MVIDSRYILKLEPAVFVDGLDIGYKKKRNHMGVRVFMDDHINKEKVNNNIEKKEQTY